MEQRKHQFLGFVVILLLIGFLTYFRKILNGSNLTRAGKILYLITMVIFIISIMFVLYFTDVNNILSFLIGLGVATMSEHIANLFILIGDNFSKIFVKFIHKFTGVDLKDELNCEKKENSENNNIKN